MPTEREYTLQELADLTGVTPRTVRYYIAQGLLPSPDGAGPAARYGERHVGRLRLVRRLQREHLPLAEIRSRLADLDDVAIAGLLAEGHPTGPAGTAVDYIRTILAGSGRTVSARAAAMEPPPAMPPSASRPALAGAPQTSSGSLLKRVEPQRLLSVALAADPPSLSSPEETTAAQTPSAAALGPDRSQWDRVSLTPDIELHVRRPLSRSQNKQVERLIAIARQLLEEDQS